MSRAARRALGRRTLALLGWLGWLGWLGIGELGGGAAARAAPPDCPDAERARSLDLTTLARVAGAADQRGESRCAAALWHRLSRRRVDAGEHEVGLAAAERGVAAARAAGDRVLEAEALGDRGNAHFYRLDKVAARRDFEAALARLGDAEAPRVRVALEQDLGITLSTSGEKDVALLHLHRAVEIAERDLPGGPWPPLWSNLGSVYEGLDAAPLALDAYDRAVAAATVTGQVRHLHDAHTRRGVLLRAAGRASEGRTELEEALALSAHFDGKVERLWTLGYLGEARAADGDLAAAEAAHREGAAIARTIGYPAAEAFHLAGLAELALDRGESAAIELLDRARDRLAGSRAWPARRIERLRARWEERWGTPAAAVAACGRALDDLERDRDRLTAVEDRRRLLAQERGLYADCLEVALAADGWSAEATARAFAWSERARARLWRAIDRIPAERADTQTPDPESSARKPGEGSRVALVDRLAELARRDQETALDPGVALEARQIESDQLQRRLAPPAATATVTGAGAAPTTLAARLGADAVLVAYFLGEARSVAFVLRRGGLAAVRIAAGREELAERIDGFVELLAADHADGWLATGRALAHDLVAPLAPHLPAGARRMIVVVDGPLALLPFDALPLDAVAGTPDGVPTIIDRWVLQSALSATEALVEPRAARAGVARGALVVADPSERAARTPRAAQALRLYALEGLRPGPLPFAEREAARLAAALGPGTVRLERGAAEESAVKRELARPLALAHFATHGFASSWSDRRSALVLGPSAADDGFLQAREVRALVLDADLVTLAACQSALDRSRAGDSTRSLANAFVEAGARSVVAALWELPDRATEALMRDFYAGLRAGSGRAEALRDAKLRRRRAGDPPRAWAAWVLIGDGASPLAAPWTAGAPSPLGAAPTVLVVASASLALAAFAALAARAARRRTP